MPPRLRLESHDATGNLVRLVPIISENSLSGAPPAVLDAAHTLLQSGAFLKQKVIDYDPFMKPGEIGKSVATRGGPTGAASRRDEGAVLKDGAEFVERK